MFTKVIRRAFCMSDETIFAKRYTLEKNLPDLQKQLIWRSTNLGMRELDLLVSSYAKQHIPKFSYDQCIKFNEDVLLHETPMLNKYLLGQEKYPEGNEYIPKIIDFAVNKPKYNYF